MKSLKLLISVLVLSGLLVVPTVALASGTVYVYDDRSGQWFSCTGVYNDAGDLVRVKDCFALDSEPPIDP